MLRLSQRTEEDSAQGAFDATHLCVGISQLDCNVTNKLVLEAHRLHNWRSQRRNIGAVNTSAVVSSASTLLEAFTTWTVLSNEHAQDLKGTAVVFVRMNKQEIKGNLKEKAYPHSRNRLDDRRLSVGDVPNHSCG